MLCCLCTRVTAKVCVGASWGSAASTILPTDLCPPNKKKIFLITSSFQVSSSCFLSLFFFGVQTLLWLILTFLRTLNRPIAPPKAQTHTKSACKGAKKRTRHASTVVQPSSSRGSKCSSANDKDASRRRKALERQFALAQQKARPSGHQQSSTLEPPVPETNIGPLPVSTGPQSMLSTVAPFQQPDSGGSHGDPFSLPARPGVDIQGQLSTRILLLRRPLPPQTRGSALGRDSNRVCRVTFRPLFLRQSPECWRLEFTRGCSCLPCQY